MSRPNDDTINAPSLRQPFNGAPKRVLLVGWDAADWQLINPLIENGEMPTLANMLNQGVWGNLASMQPMLSPMLWNSIATGKRPDQHGIHGFTEPSPDPGTGGVRLVSSTSRTCKSIWNILTQAQLRSLVVGWYASHPAEPISGVMVSNLFEQFAVKEGVATPPPAGSVHPPEFADLLAEFRVSPQEIDVSAILPFIPSAAELIKQPKHRIGALQRLISQIATVHATATHLLTTQDWDFSAVYYEGIDRFGHEFMEFHPPKMDQVSQADFEAYQHCMVGVYKFHDMMLQSLLQIAGEDTAVVLISDHGYYSDHLRPDPHDEHLSPAAWHRPFGVFAAQGPGITQGARLYGASLLDIAPTLLQLMGLPASADMPGRVLSEILTNPNPIDRIMSWDELPGESGMHAAEIRTDPAQARESLRQLVDLGYIEAPSDDEEKAARDATFWNTLNLAQSLYHAARLPKCIDALDTLDEHAQATLPVRLLKAACLLGMSEHAAARTMLDALAQDAPDHLRVRFMLGTLDQAEGNNASALEHLTFVEQASPRLPGLHNKLGTIHLAAKRHDQAIAAFNTALSIDADSPSAHLGLARVHLACNESDQAADQALHHAMHAVELTHHLPAGHFVIAKALILLDRPQDAIQALRVCIAQAPQMPGAYELLTKLYRNLGMTQEAIDTALRKANAQIPKAANEQN